MTCPPFCDTCGGNLGHPANGDWTCAKCKIKALRACRKERIRKDEFDAGDPEHFRLQSRGGAWRYYRKVESGPRPWSEIMGQDPAAELARKLAGDA